MKTDSQQKLKHLIFRPMKKEDVGSVPLGCQGNLIDIYSRIEKLGSAAILVFEKQKHIAQLQFREYDPRTCSPNGLWDPLYWGDFGIDAPILPDRILSIYCYHVGQIDESEKRDKIYHGMGIGKAMLEKLLYWAKDSGFNGLTAKATPESRPVMSFMGGQPLSVYKTLGFETFNSFIDKELLNEVKKRGIVSDKADPREVALVSNCVKYFK